MSRYHILVRRLLFLCGLGQAAGCGLAKPDPDADAFARKTIEMVQRGDSAGLSHIIDQSLISTIQWTNWLALRDSLQTWKPDTLELIGLQSLTMDGRYSISLTYQLHGPTRWGTATIPLERRARGFVVMGLNLESLPGSLQELNALTFRGRTWRHYLILTLGLVSVLLSVGTAILIARTPMPRRWLWTFTALVGLGKIGINWTSGELFVYLPTLQLLGASCLRPGTVGPWIVSFSLPVGALWALWHRRSIRQRGGTVQSSGNAA